MMALVVGADTDDDGGVVPMEEPSDLGVAEVEIGMVSEQPP